MREKIIKKCDFFIEIVILMVVFLLPLYFSFFYENLSAFKLNVAIDRTVIFKIATEILLLLTIIKFFLNKELAISLKFKQFFIFLLLIISFIISTIISIDPHTSFWGSYWRQQGLLLYLYYFTFFVLLLINIKNKKQTEKIFTAILFSSFFVSLFAVLQWFEIDLIFRKAVTDLDRRVISTLGQPVFLGNYLLLVIFITFYKISKNTKFIKSLFLYLLLLLQFSALVFTYTRGAWLAIIVSLPLILLLYFFVYKKKYFNKLFLIFLFLFVFFLGFVFFNQQFFDIYKVKQEVSFDLRLRGMFDMKGGSSAARLKYWSAAIDSFIKKPFLGYGPETQALVFSDYIDPTWYYFGSVDVITDRAHNEFLEILMNRGLLGLLTYVLVLIYVVIKAIKKLKNQNSKDKQPTFYLLIAILIYQVGLFFSFSMTEQSVYYWLYLAIIILLINDFKKYDIIRTRNFKNIYLIALFYSLAVLSLILLLSIKNHIGEIRAEHHYQLAKHDYRKKNYVSMINNYQVSTRLNPREEYYRTSFMLDLVNSGTTSLLTDENTEIDILDYIEPIVAKGEKLDNNYYRLINKALVLSLYAQFKDVKYLDEANKIYNEIHQKNPYILNVYKNWGLSNANVGNYRKAIEIYSKVFEYLPDLNNAYFKEKQKEELTLFLSDIYFGLADSYCKIEEIESCLDLYKAVLKIRPKDGLVYKIISDIYYKMGDYDMSIWYNNRGVTLYPLDVDWYRRLAFLYRITGDEILSQEYLDRGDEILSEN